MLLDLAWRLRRWWLRTTGRPTRGVKAMVFDADGRVLLVRNSYGDREAWGLPGGGIKRGESPEAAARREVREETGCTMTAVVAAGVLVSTDEGWRDTISLFRGVTADAPNADAWEIADAVFFDRDALPATTTNATRRRLAELAAGTVSTEW